MILGKCSAHNGGPRWTKRCEQDATQISNGKVYCDRHDPVQIAQREGKERAYHDYLAEIREAARASTLDALRKAGQS